MLLIVYLSFSTRCRSSSRPGNVYATSWKSPYFVHSTGKRKLYTKSAAFLLNAQQECRKIVHYNFQGALEGRKMSVATVRTIEVWDRIRFQQFKACKRPADIALPSTDRPATRSNQWNLASLSLFWTVLGPPLRGLSFPDFSGVT